MRHRNPGQAAPLPDRELTYGELIRDLSEPESGPHADNLMTNEDSFPRVCGEIAERVGPGNVYLGVGPDQNFSYIAHARPDLGFVVDFRRRNVLLHLLHRALFALSETRVEYLERLTGRRTPGLARLGEISVDDLVAGFDAAVFERAWLEEVVLAVARFLQPLDVVSDQEWTELARIQSRLAGPGMRARFLALPSYPTFGQLIRTTDRGGQPSHVLADEETFRRVRDSQRDGRILPIVGDFAGDGALPRLAGWLRRQGRKVGLLYISDVEFFLLRGGHFDAYIANLRRIPWAKGAQVARTSTRPIVHPERVAGDASTTILRPVDRFLEAVETRENVSTEDLFDF